MAQRLTLLMLMALSSVALGQEVPDLTGTWQYTVHGLPVHERCGQAQQVGELVIDRKITARAYRGKARSVRSMEKCPGTDASESTATIRVKDGNLVTIDYDEDTWTMDRLRYVDGTMSGDLGDGISTTWQRFEEQGDDGGLTDEQIAEVDEFIGTIEPELNAALVEAFHEKYRKYLHKTGLSKADSSQVADLTVNRMTTCMLTMMRKSVLVQEVPISQLVSQRGVTFIFDPDNVDARTAECIKDAERNAGIRIY
jgi:hypothetical protein